MKKTKFFFLPLFIYLFNFGFCENFPFNVGETINYTAKFNFIPAGSAGLKIVSLDTLNGLPSLHIKYFSKTGAFADRFFKIRDRVDSWVDAKELFLLKQSKSIRQGSYSKNSKTQLNYIDSIAIVGQDTIPILEHVFNPYSLFYYLRTIPLNVGETLTLTTFDNKSFTDFLLRVDKIESIKVPAGDFNCIVVKPYRDGKTLLKNEGDMTMWFTNDKRRIPAQILVKLKYGTMTLKLNSFSS